VATAGVPAMQGKIDGYPCPHCGAPTTFKPGTDSLQCDHCDAKVPIPPSDARIESYDLLAKSTDVLIHAATITAGAREVVCKVCGAHAVTARQSDRCAFCDSPMVVEVDEPGRTIPPGGVLPFVTERQAAGAQFKKWLSSRWFAPRDLVNRAEHAALDGVYLPYWSIDALIRTSYAGERGDYYYETETYTENGETKTREVRRTRWHSVSGFVVNRFNDMLVCGSASFPERLIQKLEPWDVSALRPFDGRYLAGFMAEKYRVDPEAALKKVGERVYPKIRHSIERDIGGDEQQISSTDSVPDEASIRHLLLPLWLTAFRFNKRLYHVTVNARTGHVVGERPWSLLKILALVLVIAAAVAGVVLAVVLSQDAPDGSDSTGSAKPLLMPLPPIADAAPIELPKPEPPVWVYTTDTDARGATTRIAQLISTTTTEFSVPYGGASHLRIVVRKGGKGSRVGTDAMIHIDRGRLQCSTQGCATQLKFDDGKTQAWHMNKPEGADQLTLFFSNATGFIDKIRTAKKLIIEAKFVQEGSRQFEFDVTALQWDDPKAKVPPPQANVTPSPKANDNSPFFCYRVDHPDSRQTFCFRTRSECLKDAATDNKACNGLGVAYCAPSGGEEECAATETDCAFVAAAYHGSCRRVTSWPK
jgi:hypothetical protein